MELKQIYDVQNLKLRFKTKKALEIKKVKEGTKTFGAINPASLPSTPSGGINTP